MIDGIVKQQNLFVGLKVGPQTTKQYLDQITEYVDFIEVYAVPGISYEILAAFQKPIIIHAAHFGNGVNFANPKRYKQNEAALHQALLLADKYSAKKIIFHPELKEDETCTLSVLEAFIQAHYDKRFHIESMPFSSMGYEHFARSVEEIHYLQTRLNVKLCLDLAHTTEYLTRINAPLDTVSSYFSLMPGHFHITDTDLVKVFENSYNEEHVNFGEGNLRLSWYKELLPTGSSITIETPMNPEKQLQEIKFLKQ